MATGEAARPGRDRGTARAALARRAVLATAGLSRRAGLGSGSTIGGHIGLAIDPELLAHLRGDRPVALVSGTNGKTTTTRLLAEALGGAGHVATSAAGANMTSGIVTALCAATADDPAVLEVDEAYLPRVADALRPDVIVLLNLSRDQLDRVSEVRMLAERWHDTLATTTATVVANADDPLVTYAARDAPRIVWVAAGGNWHLDAFHCPNCGARITFPSPAERARIGWSCTCGFSRPEVRYLVDGEQLIGSDGSSRRLALALPGQFNRANAAMAAIAAALLGPSIDEALSRAAKVTDVAGRFSTARHGAVTVRLLLAKNPAGWTELIDLVAEQETPLVIGINANDADGHDPSWLWDVPFERLAGRVVVATGTRRHDLTVRLLHAGVAPLGSPGQLEALALPGAAFVDYIGNYTAFQELRRDLERSSTAPPMGATSGGGRGAPSRPARSALAGSGRTSALRIALVHPDLLGTYGDGGNARILANRAMWRGHSVELVLAASDEALPASCDIYCLGGGEDGPQIRSTTRLSDGSLGRAVEAGAVVLAVCAGYQILGHRFAGPDGTPSPGLGLLDIETVRGPRRAVGEILTAPAGELALVGFLSGFENHAGHTRRGDSLAPLGRVRTGVGNGDGTDGARSGSVFGTYLHGPVLARNPSFADVLLALATGAALAPLPDEEEGELRNERLVLAEAGRSRFRVRRRV